MLSLGRYQIFNKPSNSVHCCFNRELRTSVPESCSKGAQLSYHFSRSACTFELINFLIDRHVPAHVESLLICPGLWTAEFY